jgi:hypothetical protein
MGLDAAKHVQGRVGHPGPAAAPLVADTMSPRLAGLVNA